jgi:fatty acid desaturase
MDTTLLPAALKGDKDALSASARDAIAALNGAQPGAFTRELAWAWIVIVSAIVWAEQIDTAWATAIAIFVVATRQNVLGLLVHDQAHLLGYRGRFGDLAVDAFAAYPILVLTVEGYAQVHLAHHRNYFGDLDPDFRRKSGEEWSYPKAPWAFAKLLVTDVAGINTVNLIRGKKASGASPPFARRHRVPRFVRPAYFVGVAALLTLTGSWSVFLLYWVLPLVTVTQLFIRWGAVCEHKYNLRSARVADSTPLIVLGWWEKLLFPNLNFTMHAYHHHFPSVAFSRLPLVHAIYERAGMIEERHVFRGYFAYLRYLTGHPAARPVEVLAH